MNLCNNAMITYANNYQFARDEVIKQTHVQSRMLLWCKSGDGTVEINNKSFRLNLNEFLFLPWDRKIEYFPSKQDPFYVAGIHIIPDYKKSHPCVFNVAHNKRDGKSRASYVKDMVIPNLNDSHSGNFKFSKELQHLAEYIVLSFLRSEPKENEMRTLANLLLNELINYFSLPEKSSTLATSELGRIIQFIKDHINKPLSLKDLENFSELSSGGICRLFQRHLKTTPCQKIAELKMESAKYFLSAGRISVANVGSKVGIDDPYYFSKRFKKICGVSPLEYRKQNQFL